MPKKKSFTFPPVDKMGQRVLTIEGLTHGYPGRPLFKKCNLEIGKGDRVAIIGPNGAGWEGGQGNGLWGCSRGQCMLTVFRRSREDTKTGRRPVGGGRSLTGPPLPSPLLGDRSELRC